MNYKNNFSAFINDFKYLCQKYYEEEIHYDLITRSTISTNIISGIYDSITQYLPLREAKINIHEIIKKLLDDNNITSNDWIHSDEYRRLIIKLDNLDIHKIVTYTDYSGEMPQYYPRKIFIKEMDSSTIKNHLWYMRNLKSSSPDIRAKAHAYTLIKNFESMFDTSSPNNEKRFIELKKTIDKFLGVKNGGSKRRLLKSY